MSEKLEKLLQKYEEGTLTAEEHQELSDIAGTPEGRNSILGSKQPEAVFLSPERTPLPPWEKMEAELEAQICRHKQYSQVKNFMTSKKFYALAATILITLMLTIPTGLNRNNKINQPEETKFFYTLKHRMPQEILPHLNNFKTEETRIYVNSEEASLEITDSPENLANLERVIKLLDRQPLKLELDLKILSPNSPQAGMMQQVGALPSEEVDLENYDLVNQLQLSAMEGRQLKQVVEGRYDITCYVTINPEATEANIVTLTVYDLENKKLIFRGRDIPLSQGWTQLQQPGNTQGKNNSTIIALSLNNIIQD